jgi:hypothetical protein
MHRSSLSSLQAMGFSWDYVSGAFGLHHKLSTGKVWLNGGEHDLLVHLLHFRTTDVCASLLPRPDEPKRIDVMKQLFKK